MKILLLIALFTGQAFAQVSNQQSDSSIDWLQIEDKDFQIVFPNFMEAQAQYTFNLLHHYAPIVGQTYDHKKEKITLVLRPQVANPNGFVTLAPRRTEWFNHASLTPLVGSLEWLQALAVHEYRHVVQFDSMKKDNLKLPYYLFGESGLQFFMNIVMPNWYFEGDAVWAETVYTDAGRGRSPRFSERLKALLTYNNIPTYDALLAGDFTTYLPNLYVYGYFLVARTVKLHGKKAWKNILDYAIARPWNPYAFYNGFEHVTGTNFDQFFNQTMQELQKTYKKEYLRPPRPNKTPYQTDIYPLEEGYYLSRSLDTIWQLRKDKELVTELNIGPSLSRIDKSGNKIAYASPLPDTRFGLKSYNDLKEIDLLTGSIKQLTTNKRYYHPQYSPSGQQLLAINMDQYEKFRLHIFKNGEITKSLVPKKNEVFSEAVWKSEEELIILVIKPDGQRYLAHYFLNTNDLTPLTEPTRDNLYSLHHYQDSVYFEADYMGAVNIFSLNLTDDSLGICTDELIGAYQPRVIDSKLYYAAEREAGKRIKFVDVNCEAFEKSEIFKNYNYIGDTPSDNYTQTEPIKISNFSDFYQKSRRKNNYNDDHGVFKPHSWSFYGGRGLQVSLTADNYLGTQSLNAYTGVTSEENQPFAGLSYTFAKYFPIISLGVDALGRERTLDDETSNWSEVNTTALVSVPYFHAIGVFNGSHSVGLTLRHSAISENTNQISNELSDDSIITKGISLSSSLFKQRAFRDLQSPLGYTLNLKYLDIEQAKTNYFGSARLDITTPGLAPNHGFRFSLLQEYRAPDEDLYQINNDYVPIVGYNFSRGFAYEFSEKFTKFSTEYVLPLSYPNTGLWDWIYFPRLYAKAFYDHTLADIYQEDNIFQARSLNSAGLELYLNSNTLRKFPLTYGLRYIARQSRIENNSNNALEIFFQVGY